MLLLIYMPIILKGLPVEQYIRIIISRYESELNLDK